VRRVPDTSTAPAGYDRTTKVLHWATVAVLLAQFTVAVLLLLEDDDPVLGLHVLLGSTVLVLALSRVYRRRAVVTLPPWAEGLGRRARAWAHRIEQLLYLSLVLMPLSGAAVLLVDDDLLPLHLATHALFALALTGHLTIVLGHRLVHRMI